jgi:hypothetical protein
MPLQIVTLAEWAYTIRLTEPQAEEHILLVELAEGLVIEAIGHHDEWPTTAKAVVLAAAGRAYFNPAGSTSESAGGLSRTFREARMGVFLTDDELGRLKGAQATFSFPGTWPYPDPVERDADPVEG